MALANITAPSTLDTREIAQFDALKEEWWNPKGSMKPLHKINPVRLKYILDQICGHFTLDPKTTGPFSGLKILDVGCGGGLLCEPLARLGATITGIDPGKSNIQIATAHAAQSELTIDYRAIAAEDLLATDERFDVVLAMEVIEHVANVDMFVASISGLVKPGGLFIGSTLNRTLRSFALAIVGAEYILRWLPKGTHAWEKFVTPAEFADALSKNKLETGDTYGMVYNPLTDSWSLSGDTAVNYFIAARKLLGSH